MTIAIPSATLTEGKLAVIYWYDDAANANGGTVPAIPGGQNGVGDQSDSHGGTDGTNTPIRAIPKTGQAFPWGYYITAGALFLCAVGIAAFILLRGHQRGWGLKRT